MNSALLNSTTFDTNSQNFAKPQIRTPRIKERMIEDSVFTVLRWRKLSEKDQNPKITLKRGAEIIGVAKKSLDDYLLQLRLGCRYGFDFKRHA
jgi:hypothetical protein